jgi:polysaccharide pyruvyl transferase WcaK-like protein
MPTGSTPTILLHSGWNRYNVGDVAHTPGLLRLLQQHIPEARVRVWMASYPEWLAGYLAARFPDVETLHGRLGGGHGPTDDAIEAAFDGADLFLFNSGPVFNHGHERVPGWPVRTKGWRGFDWNATMEPVAKLYYARSRGVPFGIFGQSFIHIAEPADVILPDILSQAAFVSTRETESLQYLRDLGVDAPDMGFTPDAAWAFDLRDDERVVPWLDDLGLQPEGFLAMTTRYPPIGVDEKMDRDFQVRLFRRVVEDWTETTGLPVLLIPEMASSIELNRALIYEPLPASLQERVILDDRLWTPAEEFWTPDESLSVLARARCYLNVDHHGVLHALGGAATPSVHPRQPQAGRKAQVLADVGLSEWLFNLYADEPSAVSAALRQIHEALPAARGKATQAVDRVRRLHGERMQAIRRLLGLRGTSAGGG